MCGRYHHHLSKMHGWSDSLRDWPIGLIDGDVFPRSQIAVYRNGKCEAMRWGMIHPYAAEFDSRASTHNARIETIDQKWTFKSAWQKKQRCLIPMAGYYEFTGSKGNKQMHYITDPEVDGLVVAGLWEQWKDGRLSCTMITQEADLDMNQINHRMLFYLSQESASSWLEGEMTKEDLLKLERPKLRIALCA